MKVSVEKQPKSTLKITITVEADQVKKSYEQVLDQVVKETELPGFRKGMAPRDMVKEKADISKLYGEVVNNLLQTYYPQALKENAIAPVSNPKVEIKEFDINKDFEFVATVATRPEVKIGEYKTKLKELYENKLTKAKEGNAEKLKNGEPIEEPHIHMSPNEAIDEILKVSDVEVPEMLIEDETERMMTRLIDQAQSIGLSLDQYLKAQNKTPEQLRADYSKVAENSLKSEFVLSELVKESKITVDDAEIEDAIVASGQDPANFKDNVEKWYIKSILEKNKLLSELIDAAEIAGGRTGDHHHE